MNNRQQSEAQALLRSSEFAATRLADFTHQPPTKVDLKFASARGRLLTTITDLGGKQAIQAGGSFSEETASQAVLRDELEEELRDINLTAAAIAEETRNPALMERFRMPHGQSDNALAASARAIAAAIRELALNDEFEAHGHPADTAADLEDLADGFDGKEGEVMRRGIAGRWRITPRRWPTCAPCSPRASRCTPPRRIRSTPRRDRWMPW